MHPRSGFCRCLHNRSLSSYSYSQKGKKSLSKVGDSGDVEKESDKDKGRCMWPNVDKNKVWLTEPQKEGDVSSMIGTVGWEDCSNSVVVRRAWGCGDMSS